jgi:hypothetical protein
MVSCAANAASTQYGTPSVNASAYPNLQAAIDAIPSGGGTLVVDGQFEATPTTTCTAITGIAGPCVYLRSKIRIVGDGVTSKIYTTAVDTTALQIIASDLVTVSGVDFAGPWSNGMASGSAVAVRVDTGNGVAATRVTVENCRVHNFPFDGLWARNGTSQVHFLHNEAYENQGNAIEVEAEETSLIDNDVHDNLHQGFEIYSTAQRVRVSNNRVVRNLVGIKLINDPAFGILSEIAVVGNNVSNNTYNGILYQSVSPGAAPSGHITISANTVNYNQNAGITLSYAGIGMAVTDNVVASNTYYDINVTQTNNIVIANNVLTALPGDSHAAAGIYISPNSNQITVANNMVDGF